MANELIVKPEFGEDIQAKITSLGEITSNFLAVKEQAQEIKEYYSKIIYNEDNLDLAKKDRTQINKYQKCVSEYRINLKKEFSKPFEEFEKLAKETETILKETSASIGTQIDGYEEIKLSAKKQNLIQLYYEYAQSKNIDIPYEKMEQNVTLSASNKKLEEEIRAFIDKVADDLALIKEQEHAEEILIEYKEELNVTRAILKVNDRLKRIAMEKEIRDRQKAAKEEFQENLSKFVELPMQNDIPSITPLEKPTEEAVIDEQDKEKSFILTFTVKGTLNLLKKLKQYIQELGLEIID